MNLLAASRPLLLRRLGLVRLGCVVATLAAAALPVAARAQNTPYNPYADSQDTLPPVAADGTLHWGTFYKSAAVQKAYERLWNLGACRGTNKAITIPVERNRLVIDNLPEASFTGTVREATGTLAGGMIAFTEGSAAATAPVVVAQLHPAGVTRLAIGGRTSPAALKPGVTIRFRGQVDERGRVAEPLSSLDIVSLPPHFTPDPLRPQVTETVVGTIQHLRQGTLTLRIDAGKIRRVTVRLSPEARVMIVDAAQLDLIAPGDRLEVTGRRWSGAGAINAGTVFASHVIVHKAAPGDAADQPSADAIGAR
jgi:hypothetical protein